MSGGWPTSDIPPRRVPHISLLRCGRNHHRVPPRSPPQNLQFQFSAQLLVSCQRVLGIDQLGAGLANQRDLAVVRGNPRYAGVAVSGRAVLPPDTQRSCRLRMWRPARRHRAPPSICVSACRAWDSQSISADATLLVVYSTDCQDYFRA